MLMSCASSPTLIIIIIIHNALAIQSHVRNLFVGIHYKYVFSFIETE